jgi:hypothetical protein
MFSASFGRCSTKSTVYEAIATVSTCCDHHLPDPSGSPCLESLSLIHRSKLHGFLHDAKTQIFAHSCVFSNDNSRDFEATTFVTLQTRCV